MQSPHREVETMQETASLHRKRSFSLPRLLRSRPSAGERHKVQEMARKVRVQKAAAWQWYTRAVGEAVVPTKRPPVGESLPSHGVTSSARGKNIVNGSSEGIATNSNVSQKAALEPLLSGSPRVASRFKAESARACGQPHSPSSQTPPPAPFAGPSTTPLYDEFELSGLRTHMADFVQHLQPPRQTTDNEKLPLRQPQLHVGVDSGGLPLPAPAAGSADLQHTTSGPSTAAAAIAGLTKPTPSASPFHMRPFFPLHKLFHKVVSGSVIKSSKKDSPLTNTNSTRAVYIEPGDRFEEEKTIPQYHYHHYIHHHHHHYHYNTESPDKRATIHSRRRYSESGDLRPHIPSPWETEPIEKEEEAEKRILFNDAYQLARRRRHSDTFAARLTPTRAAFDDQEEMQEGSAKVASPLQLPTRCSSQRISPSKCRPAILEYSKLDRFNAEPGTDEEFLGIRKQEAFGTEKESGGKSSGGNTYRLSMRARDSAMPEKPLAWRRQSEGSTRIDNEMGKGTPYRGSQYWHSPSARYPCRLT